MYDCDGLFASETVHHSVWAPSRLRLKLKIEKDYLPQERFTKPSGLLVDWD